MEGDLQEMELPEDKLEDFGPVQLGTEKQLLTFFDKYRNFSRVSDKCALDGRYFWKVLAPYSGLIPSELYIRINDLSDRLKISPVAFDHRELENVNSDKRYRLIKMILDISSDPTYNKGSVHTNLIYFDTLKGEIVRFEPMYENKYTQEVDDHLRKYFNKLFPDYTYRMCPDHPQLPITETCPRKGMCAAYVLKKAMKLILGLDHRMNGTHEEEELRIMRFAGAIMEEYGYFNDVQELDDTDYKEEGRDGEYGRRGIRGGRFYRGRRGGLLPLAIGAGAALSFLNLAVPRYPIVTPYGYPGLNMYSAPYYGYGYGPRWGRAPGWGWGRPYGGFYGMDAEGQGEHGCGCGAKKRVTGK